MAHNPGSTYVYVAAPFDSYAQYVLAVPAVCGFLFDVE